MILEVLYDQTKDILDKLSKEGIKFPLVGGTGLVLQLGHRKSIYLDFIKNDFIKSSDINKLKKISNNYEIVYESDEQVNLFIDNVKVSLFSFWWKSKYKTITYKNMRIRDYRDIAASKCYTLRRRNEYKDYVDLYYILNSGKLDLDRLINDAEKMFGGDFSAKLFIKQLNLIDQTEESEIDYLKQSLSKKEINNYLKNAIKNYLNK